MSRFCSSIWTGLLALVLAIALPACGGDSESTHSHGGDEHTHEEASGRSQENADHENAEHTHGDTSITRLDRSGMDADHAHDQDSTDTHSHGGDDHSHE